MNKSYESPVPNFKLIALQIKEYLVQLRSSYKIHDESILHKNGLPIPYNRSYFDIDYSWDFYSFYFNCIDKFPEDKSQEYEILLQAELRELGIPPCLYYGEGEQFEALFKELINNPQFGLESILLYEVYDLNFNNLCLDDYENQVDLFINKYNLQKSLFFVTDRLKKDLNYFIKRWVKQNKAGPDDSFACYSSAEKYLVKNLNNYLSKDKYPHTFYIIVYIRFQQTLNSDFNTTFKKWGHFDGPPFKKWFTWFFDKFF